MDRADAVVETRRKYAEGWNDTMIKIWRERMNALGVYDTGALFRSVTALRLKDADNRFTTFTLSESFLEYGIWQDLGVGREVPHGNPGDIGRDKVRERRRWFSVKYFMSIMKIRDFIAESLGREFIGVVADALDSDALKSYTSYYARRGY